MLDEIVEEGALQNNSVDFDLTILPEHECWDLLAGVTLGRLVTS